MPLTAAEKELHQATVTALHGVERRLYMARVAESLGWGGPSLLERELGWNRGTVSKGLRELRSGVRCVDDYTSRGRHRTEARLPHLLDDIRAIANQYSQTDPSFKSARLYLRLSAASVRQQLIDAKGYAAATLPSAEVIRQRLNALGYTLRAVKKRNP